LAAAFELRDVQARRQNLAAGFLMLSWARGAYSLT
jgi:hypothetical protein